MTVEGTDGHVSESIIDLSSYCRDIRLRAELVQWWVSVGEVLQAHGG